MVNAVAALPPPWCPMRMPRSLFLLVALLACRPSGAHEAPTADAAPAPAMEGVTLPPELDRVLRDYEAGWQSGDEVALASLFTADGFVLPNGEPPVRGREAILRQYRESGGELRLRALAYGTGGSLGYIIGAYGYGKAPPVPDVGKFTLLLRLGPDGRWVILSDMDNGNRRPS